MQYWATSKFRTKNLEVRFELLQSQRLLTELDGVLIDRGMTIKSKYSAVSGTTAEIVCTKENNVKAERKP